jgi:hypothetical protein
LRRRESRCLRGPLAASVNNLRFAFVLTIRLNVSGSGHTLMRSYGWKTILEILMDMAGGYSRCIYVAKVTDLLGYFTSPSFWPLT